MGGLANLDEVVYNRTRVFPPGPDARRDKWIGWIDAIGRDVSDLFIARMAWRGMVEIWTTRTPPLPDSFVFAYFANTYVRTQAVGIRRQVDRRRDVQSMARLLDELARFPDRIGYDFFVGRYAWGSQWVGHDAFEEFDPTRTGKLDPRVPRADHEALLLEGEQVKTWVDQHVAHLALTPTAAVPTFDELDSGLDLLGELYQKWLAVLTGAGLTHVEPVPQYDWVAPFRQPWILTASKFS